MSDLLKIDSSLPAENDKKLLNILVYGNSKFNAITNQNILICNVKIIKESHIFYYSLFQGTCIPLELFSVFFCFFFSCTVFDNVIVFIALINIFPLFLFLNFPYLMKRLSGRALLNVF